MFVRRATPFDISEIFLIVSKWHEETPMDYPAWEDAASINWVADAMTKGVVFVATDEDDGKIVGSIGFSGQQFPWNKSVWVLWGEWLYVDIDKRAGGAAAMLIDAAKDFSDECESPIFLSTTQGLDAELKDRLISICGFDYAGGNFVYNL